MRFHITPATWRSANDIFRAVRPSRRQGHVTVRTRYFQPHLFLKAYIVLFLPQNAVHREVRTKIEVIVFFFFQTVPPDTLSKLTSQWLEPSDNQIKSSCQNNLL